MTQISSCNTNFWSQFDIYCINLLSRQDRFDHMTMLFARLGIKATIIRVKKHLNPKIGIIESNMQIFDLHIAKNSQKHLLIFEDDVIVSKSPNLNQMTQFLSSDIKWDVLRLGMNKGLFIDETPYAYHAIALGNHAVLYNCDFVIKFKQHLQCHTSHIDHQISHCSSYTYVLKDLLFYQSDFPSDNNWNSKSQIHFQNSPIEYQFIHFQLAIKLLPLLKELSLSSLNNFVQLWFNATKPQDSITNPIYLVNRLY